MDCFVCRKHRDRGTLIPEARSLKTELIVVSHILPPDALGREGATRTWAISLSSRSGTRRVSLT
jgi:hypothetical protein